jgi:secreted trypsin-like serine protease
MKAMNRITQHRHGRKAGAYFVAFSAALMLAGALPQPASAIVGGDLVRASDQARRWTVKVESSKGELCTGVVLSPRIILTAAHCVLVDGRFSIVALDAGMRRRSIGVTHVVAHETFLPGRTPSTQPGVDLALLRLAEALPQGTQPVTMGGELGTGEPLTIAGFGLGQEDRRQTARTLRQSRLMSAGSYTSSNSVVVAVDMNNLGQAPGAGACRGDSGGPITRGGPDSNELVGVVSWSSGPTNQRVRRVCGGYTAITPVAPHLDWINSRADLLAKMPEEPSARPAAPPEAGARRPLRSPLPNTLPVRQQGGG